MSESIISQENKNTLKAILNLLEKAIQQHLNARDSIQKNNNQKALNVLETENQIFNDYISIESDIAFTITKAPVDKNLRRVLAYLSIVRNISHIAKQANHLAKFELRNDKQVSESSKKRIESVHSIVLKQLNVLKIVLTTENYKQALEIGTNDHLIDEQVQKVRHSIIGSITKKNDEEEVAERLYVLNIVNALERVGDIIVRICEFLIYIETGNHTRI